MNGRPTALVTGASAGIGAAYAEELAATGHDLVITARRADRLDELAARLRNDTGAAVEVLAADLADRAGLAAVERRAAADDVTLLVNNAGFGGYCRFATIDPDVADALIDVHIRATTRLTRAVLARFVARDAGAVINVASLLAFSGTVPPDPMPARAVYAAAKAYMVAFTQLLAGELKDTKVTVQVCCPGVVATEFHTVQGMDMSKMPRMTARDLVRASLLGLARREVVCIPALEDPEALTRLAATERALLSVARAAEPAPRYRG